MSLPVFHLRLAHLSESELIADMHVQSWRVAYRGMLSDAFLDRELEADRRSHWQAKMIEIKNGLGEVVIAEVDGQPRGFLCVIRPDEANSVLVDNLHALPGHKGLGIGTRLLKFAHDWALEKRASSLHLFVLEPNTAAQGFYASRGWSNVGPVPDHVGNASIVALRFEHALAAPLPGSAPDLASRL